MVSGVSNLFNFCKKKNKQTSSIIGKRGKFPQKLWCCVGGVGVLTWLNVIKEYFEGNTAIKILSTLCKLQSIK